MPSRTLLAAAFAALLLGLSGCRDKEAGPIAVSAIGGAPRLLNPSRDPLDAPSAFLLQSVAQGLVRFDADGDIVQGLAQSWIVSDDGLRYTFRLARAKWPDGTPITAAEVVARLRAVAAPSSRNPLKSAFGAIDEIVPMTDEVLEIGLKAPRPNFLQLLAQPESAVIRNGAGAGPLYASPALGGALRLVPPKPQDEAEASDAKPGPPLFLRGEAAGLAVARFEQQQAALVLGGTAGDLPLARAARLPGGALVFDPVAGLFGLAFAPTDGPLAAAEARQALSMAVDRGAIVRALGVPNLQPRESLLPPGVEGIAAPAAPAWTAGTLQARRALAVRTLAGIKGKPLRIRVALPAGPGYRPVFAVLRRDWRAIGVEAERVGPSAPADLRLVDEVAPASLASWYLRHFACDSGRLCDTAADQALEAARNAPSQDARRAALMEADRILAGNAPFIAIAAPVRWSLVDTRLTGFRPNPLGRHAAGELIRAAP